MMSGQNIQSIINANIGRRKSADAAAKKSARLQNAGSKKSSARRTSAKSTARKAAGKKALRRAGGTGCIVKSHKNRAGAKSTLAYASEGDKNELIFSNCGNDNASQESVMNAVANLRKDCVKNTGHISISLGKGNSLSPVKWRELVVFALAELEIDTDNFASAAYLHKDTKNQHIHICYSLIGYDSKINFSHNIGDLGIATAQKIEVKFGLILTPRNDNNRGKKPPTQGMLERYRKTGEPPKLVLLQASIDAAMEEAKSMDDFQKRLELLGVNAQYNVQQKDGKLHVSGLTYAFNDNSFKASASALGDRYGLYSLKKKGLVYDPAINERHEAPSEPVNNKPVIKENARANNNDDGRANNAQPTIIQAGSGNSEAEPASQGLNAAERRKLRRAAEQKSNHNISVNSAVNGDTGDSALAKIKAQQAANVNAWEKAEAQNAIDQKLEQLQKRVSDAQAFKLDRFKYDTYLPNKFKHLVIKDLQTTDEATIVEKEAEVAKALLSSHSADEIVSTLCKHSLLHKPIPEPIQLYKNAPEAVLEMAARIGAEREAMIAEAKSIVAKAAKELAELQKSTKLKLAPKTDDGWKPPELGM